MKTSLDIVEPTTVDVKVSSRIACDHDHDLDSRPMCSASGMVEENELSGEKSINREKQNYYRSKEKTLFDLDATLAKKGERSCVDIRNRIIIVCGMRHSGSTALFNIVRLALLGVGVELTSCYSDELEEGEGSSQGSLLVKVHENREDIFNLDAVVIGTVRDLRDTVASATRRNLPLIQKLGAVDYAKYNRSLDDVWKSKRNYTFCYEEFIEEPYQSLSKLFSFPNIDSKLIDKVYDQVITLPTNNYTETLLSDTHITDPNRVMTYKDTLSSEVIIAINEQHNEWLLSYGYE